ncbi:glycosyltransferase family 25 protein, partial [Basilea psittacipulmonis]
IPPPPHTHESQLINIFIINLERSVDRRDIIIQKFKELNIEVEFTFFSAIDGKNNPDHFLFKKYNHIKRLLRKKRSMTTSQLGCYASHYSLWEKCCKLNKPIIILEDDIEILSSFTKVYQYLSSKENIYEFLWLGKPYNDKYLKHHHVIDTTDSGIEIIKCHTGWGNALAYYITPIAAKKFLDGSKEWIYNLDVYMERYWEHKVPFSAIIPLCFQVNSQGLASNIDFSKGKRSIFFTFTREWFEAKDKVTKWFFDLFHQ